MTKAIVNMNFDELIDTLTKKDYGEKYSQFFYSAIRGSAELNLMVENLSYILDLVDRKNLSYKDFERLVYENNLFSRYIVLENRNLYLKEIKLAHLIIFFYIEGFKNKNSNMIKKDAIETALSYLEKSIKTRHLGQLNELIRRISYIDENIEKKDWSSLNSDQSLTRAEIYAKNDKYSDKIVKALLRVRTKNDYIYDKIDQIMIKNYYALGDFKSAIEIIESHDHDFSYPYYPIFSYAHLGDVENVLKYLDQIKEFNQYNIYQPLIVLANNLSLEKNDEYRDKLKEIESYVEKNKDKIHDFSNLKYETREKNDLYIELFSLLTNWIIEYEDLRLIKSIGDELDQSQYEKLWEKRLIFSLCPKDLRLSLFQFFESDIKENDKINLYKNALKEINPYILEDRIKFLLYFAKAGIGHVIYDKAIELIEEFYYIVDPNLEEKFKSLLVFLYLDSVAKDKNYEDKFKILLDKYQIDQKDLDKDKKRKNIRLSLSDKGKKEYDAALLLYDLAIKNNFAHNDAGMLSMSFYRIIENESNERIWRLIMEKLGKEGLDKIFSLDHNPYRWDQIKRQFYSMAKGKKLGLMFGNLRYLMKNLKKEGELEKSLAILFKSCLTDYGLDQYEKNIMDEWYSKKNVEKYRNPPAHNNYLNIEIAKESKEYVERELLRMKDMFVY